MDNEKLRYPVGKYVPLADITSQVIQEWIDTIEAFPSRLRALVGSLSEEQLEWRYRPGGWTVRQIVHHVADSHLNSYIRFKWTLTEDRPTIKPYNQTLWAECPDTKKAPIAMSLELLTGLHKRWVYLLRGLSDEDLKRRFYHPEMNKELDLQWMVGMYAWHCRHHSGHVELALQNPAQD